MKAPPTWSALLLFVLACGTAAAVADTRRYQVLLVGQVAGEQTVTHADDGAIEIGYSFSDRGRGPDTRSRYVLDAAGLPVSVEVTGVDYMKAEVRESFARRDGVAEWRSMADQGRSARPGFYVALDGPPEGIVLLAQALLAADGGRLELLPTGEARIEVIGTLELPGDRSVRHVEIHGLDFEAQPLWLNPDGSLFAMVSAWFSVVEAGAEAQVATLLARQDERRAALSAGLARQLRDVPKGPVLIDNARILDVRRGTVRLENAVLVEGERIVALLAPGAPRPAAARFVDAAGRTLMPGLWDMHAHLDLVQGPLNIAAGVTSVRDLANDHAQLMNLVGQFDAGTAVGPRVFRAGIIDGPGPYAGPTPALVAHEADVARWVDFYAANGYQQIKVYSSVAPALVPSIVRRAHEQGLRVSGHVPAGMWADDAVRAGFDEIQHVNMLFLNFYRDVTETRNRDRFIKVAERGADLDLASPEFRAFVALLKERGTVVDPTVSVFFDLLTQVPGEPAPSIAAVHDRLPAVVARSSLKGGLAPLPGQQERYRQSAQRMLDVIGALHAAGIPLVAGTDAMPGFSLHAELEAYARAGIPAAEVLRIATLGAAAVAGVADDVGVVEPGFRADLILVDGRPDANIADIRRVQWVMKAGVMHDPAAVYRTIGVRPDDGSPQSGEFIADGRQTLGQLSQRFETLSADHGWQSDTIYQYPDDGLALRAWRTPHEGAALWILAGIHGEEPAGPNAIARSLDHIVALAASGVPMVVIPLANPRAYRHNWRYPNTAERDWRKGGYSVGDAGHLLPDPDAVGRARADGPPGPETGALTEFVLRLAETYPPRLVLDLHEDELSNEGGYIYSQGERAADNPVGAEVIRQLAATDIPIRSSGRTRFGEPIVAGVISSDDQGQPIRDGSIDELLAAKVVIVDGRTAAGPAAATVIVVETPAFAGSRLEQRVEAQSAVLRQLPKLWELGRAVQAPP